MSIKKPDIYEHNNPNRAIVDSSFVRGGGRSVADLNGLYALSGKIDQLSQNITKVYVISDDITYVLVDINNVGNIDGWKLETSGGGGGTGNVVGPNAAVSNNIPLFNGISGKIIKDSGYKITDFALSVDLTGLTHVVNTNYNLLTGETYNRVLGDLFLNNLVTGETLNRTISDINLQTQITGLTSIVNDNFNLLNNSITGETVIRTNQDDILYNLITGETSNRISSDTINYNLITGLTVTVDSNYSTLNDIITGETLNRISVDNNIHNEITGLTAIVNNNYITLNNAITGETLDRSNSESLIQNEITGLTSNFISHTGNTSNPHNTTAIQIGSYTTGETNDLLDNKISLNILITGDTKTKITYDSKGLVTSGSDATTADIDDSLNRRYITDNILEYITGLTGNTQVQLNSKESSLPITPSDPANKYLNGNKQWEYVFGGNVTGATSSSNGNIVLFDGVDGKIIKDSNKKLTEYFNISGNTSDDIPSGVNNIFITPTEKTNIGHLTGATSNIQTQLNGLVPTGVTVNNILLGKTGINLIEALGYAMSDTTTDITAGVKIPCAAIPYNFTITGVRAQVGTAAVGVLLLTLDIKKNGVSIFSTKLTFDSTESVSETATIPYVLTSPTISILTSDVIELSVFQAGGVSTAAKNLTLFLIGYKS